MQPFNPQDSSKESLLFQVKIENLFATHNVFASNSTETKPTTDSFVSNHIKITQADLDEITFDHAFQHVDESVIAQLALCGFPTSQTRRMVQQGTVLNYATAAYHLLTM